MELEIQHLSCSNGKKKREVKVFTDLNLVIPSHAFFVILGPSGCGKTTLLRALAGLKDYEGTIMENHEPIDGLSAKERGFAYISQEYALYPHMTVFDNLAFPLKNQGERYDAIFERVNQVASLLGLENFLTRKPRQLSGGQCQRVALGRALIRLTEVYLLDEPFSNLDEKLSYELRELLRTIHQESGATFIYCTHQIEEALALGNELCVLSKDGEVLQVGKPRDVYYHPQSEVVQELFQAYNQSRKKFEEAVRE